MIYVKNIKSSTVFYLKNLSTCASEIIIKEKGGVLQCWKIEVVG